MRIRLFQTGRLGSRSRRSLGLIRKACTTALGRVSGRKSSLHVVFTSNPEIRKINRRFLRHDRCTDVIAFRYTRHERTRGMPFGEIYISAEQARKQARRIGHPWLQEVLTLAIHGTLHLLGHRDRWPQERRRMFKRQDQLLKGLGI